MTGDSKTEDERQTTENGGQKTERGAEYQENRMAESSYYLLLTIDYL